MNKKRLKTIAKALIEVIIVAILVLAGFIIGNKIASAVIVKTTVTVQNSIPLKTRVLENNCNTCIVLCEGRQKCKETCVDKFCNK